MNAPLFLPSDGKLNNRHCIVTEDIHYLDGDFVPAGRAFVIDGRQFQRTIRVGHTEPATQSPGAFNPNLSRNLQTVGHQVIREAQRLKRSGVGPPAFEQAMGQGAFLQIRVVDVGDFQLAAPRWL
jgi:hypothetical protein